MTALPDPRPLRSPIAGRLALIRWRSRHVARRVGERLAAGIIRSVVRRPVLHRLPRRLVVPVELLLIGCADGRPFDGTGYLSRNPDVRQSGRDALNHYLLYGWAEGRDPRPDLSERKHRTAAGLGRGVPVSALAHTLVQRRGTQQPPPQPPADLPDVDELLARLKRIPPRPAAAPEVDVIVPVYRGRAETLNCLLHILEAGNRTPANILVVDDRGPDRELRTDLSRLARRGLIELAVQPRNLGFVASINAGMARHPDRDVIWLNSDTEVYGDWIDRLRRVADDDPHIATVTPLTNNGTIASYPQFDRDNATPPECGWSALDGLAATANGAEAVDAPTCVGFCTYVRREAIAAIGPLDLQAFGRGYGEENDFSRRAAKAGWRNVIAGGVFVRHMGAASFGSERADRIERAMQTLVRLHPEYPAEVAAYVAADPPRRLRHALDLARLGWGLTGNNVLLVTHERGGGTARHVAEEVERLAGEGQGVVLMTGGAEADTVRLSRPGLGTAPTLGSVPFGAATLTDIIRRLDIGEIHVHHVIEMPDDAPERLVWLADALDLPIDVSVHDYFSICPRINLVDLRGRYCGEPGRAACRRCLVARRSVAGAPDIDDWRRRHGALLAAARIVRVPDTDVAERLVRYFPDLKRIAVQPHERAPRPQPPAGRRDGPLRIAAIGAIGPIKGFDVLIRLAGQIARERAPVELTVIGHTRNDSAATAAGITVTGRYSEGEIDAMVDAVAPDLILIPSIWPETFCYTLSHALRSGLPIAAFDLGAQASRLRAMDEAESLLPITLADEPGILLARLRNLAQRSDRVAPIYERLAG